jgi:PAS domain S-box-containing protein
MAGSHWQVAISESKSIAPDRPREKRRLPVRFYLFGLVGVFVIAIVAGTLFTLSNSRAAALKTGERDSQFSAQLAGSEVNSDIAAFQSAVTSFATNPAVGSLYVKGAACTLNFSGEGSFAHAHLDLLRPDGTAVCSSLPASRSEVSYATSAWFPLALNHLVSVAPVADPALRVQALVIAAPVPGHGVVAAMFSLDGLAPSLTQRYGIDSQTEFLIADYGSSQIIGRSLNSPAWIGSSLKGTSFAVANAPLIHADLDGTVRVYGRAAIPILNWTVYSGIPEANVLASTDALLGPDVAVLIAGVLALAIAVVVVSRRITRPIQKLSAAVARAASAPLTATTLNVSGPAEINQLADNFTGLLARVDRELTERHRVEEEARASEVNYRVLFNASPHPRWVYDVETLRILEVNAAAIASYGYSRDEFMKMTWTALVPVEESDSITASLRSTKSVRRGGPWRNVKKDGTQMSVEITADHVKFRGRDALLVLAEDVTERDLVQRQLQQSQRIESLGELAGGIAHDFNNLLAVILSYTAFVEKKLSVAAETDEQHWGGVRDDTGQIRVAAERASRLTRQLLAFARREVTQPRVLNLNDIVDNIEAMLRRTLGEHILLDVSLDRELPPIKADPGQLEQVLVNLAVNARDAMPSGGTLVLQTSRVTVDNEYRATRKDIEPGAYVSMRISDTGVGMNPDVLSHVFEPFYSTKDTSEGTGLGLSTVYGIVIQMGGNIHIYSEPSIGTTISVLLPVSEGVPELENKPLTVPASRGERILVVEDEEPLLEVTQRILSEHGYTVLTAATAEAALAAVEGSRERIDLLLTDVVMPRMLGRELASRVTQLAPHVAVLFMSGYARPVLASRGTLDDGVSLIEKPFTENALLIKVREVLDSQATPVAMAPAIAARGAS